MIYARLDDTILACLCSRAYILAIHEDSFTELMPHLLSIGSTYSFEDPENSVKGMGGPENFFSHQGIPHRAIQTSFEKQLDPKGA